MMDSTFHPKGHPLASEMHRLGIELKKALTDKWLWLVVGLVLMIFAVTLLALFVPSSAEPQVIIYPPYPLSPVLR